MDHASDTVLLFITALNDEKFDEARQYLSDDMTFEGVLGKREGAAAYMKDMGDMKLKYKLKKVFEEGYDVCLYYDLTMGNITFPGFGLYQVDNELITSLKVIFDPRPVLEQQKAAH